MLALLRSDRHVRLFFFAHAQSSLGTGAALVGLLLIAYDRFHSPWAISLVLLADLVPAMLLSPLLGALADRYSRRWCAVAADVMRALAFLGLALVDGFPATVAFAVLAGIGTALFRPAILAGLPALVSPERLPAATSLYSAIATADVSAGPALGALALAVVAPEGLMALNAGTFVLSALLLAQVPLGAPTRGVGPSGSLLQEAVEGLRITARLPGVRVVIGASSLVLLFAGLYNVGELVFARRELQVGDAAFAILVASFGAGILAGSLAGARCRDVAAASRGYLLGLLVLSLGFIASGIAPTYSAALIAFAAAGAGNGLVVVHERLLIQMSVRSDLQGRAFGAFDSLAATFFAAAFVIAGVLLSSIGARAVFMIAGVATLLLWATTAPVVRRAFGANETYSDADRPAAAVSPEAGS